MINVWARYEVDTQMYGGYVSWGKIDVKNDSIAP